LFERLRLKLQELQKQDCTQRVVMLDTQFRMHPVLGNFVSQQFYEAESLEKVKSGRAAEDFAFNPRLIDKLGMLGQHYASKVCQWLDVSATEGKAEKRGTSRIRRAEAERIAQEIKQLFEAEQAAGSSGQNSLSVGVITFYAAQRDLIMQTLTQTEVNGTPLMIKTPEGYQPHEAFKHAFKLKQHGTTSSEEGLRVGSVDAFQGKEFDVVFLSCVRTWQEPQKRQKHQQSNQSDNDTNSGDANTHETQLNRLFGFLRLPNRMNVAMSRQRQMLICVGDAQLATNGFAEEGIPALNAFYQLCGGEHGSIR
jgi:superfamily I DNA and/or RNA helicase